MTGIKPDLGPLPKEPIAHVVPYAKYCMIFALAVAAFAILAGPLHRIGILPVSFAFGLLGLGMIGGAIAALLNIGTIARFWRGGPNRVLGIVGALTAILVAGFIFSLYRTSQNLPPIHDISTDTFNPPVFETLLADRTAEDNDSNYDNSNARLQRQGYPDIKPVLTESSTADAFAMAEEAARKLGWKIVAVKPEKGIIEATDRTLWFGFRDDIVVRVAKDGLITRIDVRSASRNLEKDIASNANRIRRFTSEYQDLSKEGGPKRRNLPRT